MTVWNDLDLESDIWTQRLRLSPLQAEHADLLFPVLDDKSLHRFIGGAPLSLEELRARYERLALRYSPEGDELWLNWIAIKRADGAAIGTMQATLAGRVATVAWVIGRSWQGQGFASEAAGAVVDWLLQREVDEVEAHIHPDHVASERVARAAGLSATDAFVEGERVWRSAINR